MPIASLIRFLKRL